MIDVDPLVQSELERAHPLPDGSRADWSDVVRRAGVRASAGRRRWPLIAIGVAALLGAVLFATPAWALVRDVLPFWDQPSSAPPSVKEEFVSFSGMLRGPAPAGGSPQAVSDDWREIDQATIGGEPKTLWVAPATGRYEFCWLWAHFGGSCGSSALPLGIEYTIVPAHDPSEPAQTTYPVDSTNLVPLWVAGYASSPAVSRVVIQFSDGSAVEPHIVWVSAPISAGFFTYDIPSDRQSSEDHATVVEAYDDDGHLVSRSRVS